MMYNPCFECQNRYGHSYTEECDNACEYANAISKLKPYGGIDEVVKCMKGDAIPIVWLKEENIYWLRGVIRFIEEEKNKKNEEV